jgi:hypothetical protein
MKRLQQPSIIQVMLVVPFILHIELYPTAPSVTITGDIVGPPLI